MAGRRTMCDAVMVRTLEEYIRNGAFDWVAAEAAGIGRRTFYRWMAWGREGRAPFAALEAKVRRARAQARVGAELKVREQQPLAWLRLGPGRERRAEPGWTLAARDGGEVEPIGELEEEDAETVAELAAAIEAVEREG